ncbi:MAG: hypothetical protein JO121_05695 [Deltaproteobacteria bacterium]|nr:hypothetical protein [Deltaproteobacteria bacterium]
MEQDVEIYTPERIAQFLLNNSVTKEGYDDACEEVRKLGFDPAEVPHTDPNMRESLPTNEEFDREIELIQEKLKRRLSSDSQS